MHTNISNTAESSQQKSPVLPPTHPNTSKHDTIDRYSDGTPVSSPLSEISRFDITPSPPCTFDSSDSDHIHPYTTTNTHQYMNTGTLSPAQRYSYDRSSGTDDERIPDDIVQRVRISLEQQRLNELTQFSDRSPLTGESCRCSGMNSNALPNNNINDNKPLQPVYQHIVTSQHETIIKTPKHTFTVNDSIDDDTLDLNNNHDVHNNSSILTTTANQPSSRSTVETSKLDEDGRFAVQPSITPDNDTYTQYITEQFINLSVSPNSDGDVSLDIASTTKIQLSEQLSPNSNAAAQPSTMNTNNCDDDDFGDFNTVPSNAAPTPQHIHNTNNNNNNSNDDWDDFSSLPADIANDHTPTPHQTNTNTNDNSDDFADFEAPSTFDQSNNTNTPTLYYNTIWSLPADQRHEQLQSRIDQIYPTSTGGVPHQSSSNDKINRYITPCCNQSIPAYTATRYCLSCGVLSPTYVPSTESSSVADRYFYNQLKNTIHTDNNNIKSFDTYQQQQQSI